MSKLLVTGQVISGQSGEPPAILQLAFRPFFLFGALFSVVSIALWAGSIAGYSNLNVYGGPLWWHVHEMLFGFVSAIVVGFLLTAVRTWTGQPGFGGLLLGCLVALWLAGRCVFFLSVDLPVWVIVLVDLLFLPLAALILAIPVVRVKQWRNIIFVPLLLIMAITNAAMHWAAIESSASGLIRTGNTMVLLVTVLMTIMAGRVVPMFTASGTGTKQVPAHAMLEKLALMTLLLAVVASFRFQGVPAILVALCFVTAGLVHGIRAFRWRIWVSFRTPLVWSLHLSYWCIVLGLILYGISEVSSAVTRPQAIHTLTVGAMGTMILSMISRVSLGHTGRALQVGWVMSGAFALILSAFVVRVFGSLWIDNYVDQIVVAAFFWVLGYGCFTVFYAAMLIGPRVDGKPG
ncbi:MAG: NnrS family protein [Halioglobus sp.]